jgi:hypothetical protein
MPRSTTIAIPIAIAAALFAAGAAQAAPQVLGLMASNGMPIPLACQSGECSAHLSSFCLQEAREAPSHGQSYRLTDESRITLIVERHDGTYLRVDGAAMAHIEALVGFTSVRLSIPDEAIAELDGARAWVEVSSNASLVPLAADGDRYPQTDEEIAVATGPYREAAARHFDAPGKTGDAARLTNVLINALPPGERENDATRDTLWSAYITTAMAANVTPEGLAKAKELYNYCRMSSAAGTALTMRDCLTLRHADLMGEQNRELWKEVGGS